VNRATAFWDASALVPVCVEQAGSREARSHLRQMTPVVWWGSVVEIRSAVARLFRMGLLTGAGKKGALLRLAWLSTRWQELLPDSSLRDLAGELLDAHDLRAADSLQLAAALIWCRRQPQRRIFLSGDRRLAAAATSLGFSVLQLP
jgi:hypothetical protein